MMKLIPNAQSSVLSQCLFITLSLLLVIVICVVCIKTYSLLRKAAEKKFNIRDIITIKSNYSLGQQGRLVVIEFESEIMLLGVTKESINCLAHRPINKKHPVLEQDGDYIGTSFSEKSHKDNSHG